MKTKRNKHELSKSQLDLIYGSLLGDSSLSVDGKSIVLSTVHGNKQHEYVKHIKNVMNLVPRYSPSL